jgi:hypothetical protein
MNVRKHTEAMRAGTKPVLDLEYRIPRPVPLVYESSAKVWKRTPLGGRLQYYHRDVAWA